jgi:hypothetical protein
MALTGLSSLHCTQKAKDKKVSLPSWLSLHLQMLHVHKRQRLLQLLVSMRTQWLEMVQQQQQLLLLLDLRQVVMRTMVEDTPQVVTIRMLVVMVVRKPSLWLPQLLLVVRWRLQIALLSVAVQVV